MKVTSPPTANDTGGEDRAEAVAHEEEADQPRAHADLGFGRIVASEIEAPNMLANMV